MWRKVILGLVLFLALGLPAGIILVQVIDGEAMKVPVANAISAMRNGQPDALEACFTRNATIMFPGLPPVQFSRAFGLLKPALGQGRWQGSARISGFSHVRRSGKLAEADVTVSVWLEQSDLPYRHVPPVHKKAHVVLEKQRLFSWKIKEVISDEAEIRFFIQPSWIE